MATTETTTSQEGKQIEERAYNKVMGRKPFTLSEQTQMYVQFLAMYNEFWAEVSNSYAYSLGEEYAVFTDDFNTKFAEAGSNLITFFMARIQESITDNMGCNEGQI